MIEKIDLHLSGDQVAAIGLFAAYFAHLETEMNFTISALGYKVNNDPTMPHRFSDRIKHWRKLVRAFYADDDPRSKALMLIDHIKAVHNVRSMLLHGRPYGQPDGNDDLIIVESHRHLDEWRSDLFKFKGDQVYEGAAQVEHLLIALVNFNERYLPVEPTTLPRRYS